jgi:hypothetical protein
MTLPRGRVDLERQALRGQLDEAEEELAVRRSVRTEVAVQIGVEVVRTQTLGREAYERLGRNPGERALGEVRLHQRA